MTRLGYGHQQTPNRLPLDNLNDRQQLDILLQNAKLEFHKKRYLRLKHLPHDVTEEKRMNKGAEDPISIGQLIENIRELLSYLDIKEINLNKRLDSARVILSHPKDLDTWCEQTLTMKGGLPILAFPSPTEHLLCVAHLPLIYTDEDFQNLVQMYGTITRCFLMRSERTGSSKGYGFVEYSSKEMAHQAKNLLEQKSIGNCTLRCDWLDPRHVTYSSLHSKCLFVDHLPPDFRDVNEFRQIFSTIVKPIYCQVIMKNGQPLGIGLVEFTTAEEAEDTQQMLNGFQIHKFKIRVTFCIPGVHAMTLFNKLTMNHPTNSKKALLPDPLITPSLYNQLQLLSVQNPQFFQTLQTLVLNQLRTTQNNNLNRQAEKVEDGKPAYTAPMPLPSGLLGNPSQPSSNSFLQAAMVILLTAQIENQMRVQQPTVMGFSHLLPLFERQTHILLENNTSSTANRQSLLYQLHGAVSVKAYPFASQNRAVGPAPGQNPSIRGFRLFQDNENPKSQHLNQDNRSSSLRKDSKPLRKNDHLVAGRPALLPNPSPFKGGLLPTPPLSEISEPPNDILPAVYPPSRAVPFYRNSSGSPSLDSCFDNRLPLLEKPLLRKGQVKRSLLGDKPSVNVSPISSAKRNASPKGLPFTSHRNVSQSSVRPVNTSPRLMLTYGGHSPTTDAATPAALGLLNAQLERLGKHPLLGLLLRAAQNNGDQLPSMNISPSTPPRPHQPAFSRNEQFTRQRQTHLPKPSLLGSPSQPEQRTSLLGDYPTQGTIKSKLETNHKRKMRPSPSAEDGQYVNSYFKKPRK